MPKPNIPFEGFPSKTAAAMAFAGQGMTARAIAERLGWPIGVVNQQLRLKGVQPTLESGKRSRRNPVKNEPGIWTVDKIAKARRLFALTMAEIAGALQVPVDELLRYCFEGQVPPMGRAGRIGDLRQKHEAAEAVAAPPAPSPVAAQILLAAPDFPESRPDLPLGAPLPAKLVEALSATPVPSPQSAVDIDIETQELIELAAGASKFRLVGADGRYVHESLDGFTGNRRFAWCGNRKQLRMVLAKHPDFKRLDKEPVFA